MDTVVQPNRPLYYEWKTLRFNSYFPLNVVKESVENNSKIDIDLIIASRPKSGTTLLSHIVHLILNDGNKPDKPLFAYRFYEYQPPDFDPNAENNRVMLSHLPISSLPQNNGKTKFIFVLRNPKDVVVSYYYFAKSFPKYEYHGDFHQLFNLWINGEVMSGDFFDHVLDWFKCSNNPNILFVIYENLIRNKTEEIVRIASFIDDKYQRKLVANDYNNTYLNNVLKHSSLEHMKNEISFPRFVRKGIIGGWRNYLSREESDIIDQKMQEKLGETGLVEIWKNDMLWLN